MSDDVGQIRGTVVIGSELQGLDDAETAFKHLERVAAEAESRLGDLALDVDVSSLAGAEAAIENIGVAASGLSDTLAGTSLEVDTSSLDGAAEALGETTAAAADLGAGAAQTGADVADLGAKTDRTRDALGRYSSTADKAKTDTKGLGDEADRTAKGLGGFSDGLVAGAAALTAIGAGLGVATAKAAEYQQAVTLISTLSADTAARFDEYKTGILEVSQALGQDAVAGAKAAYDALSSGVAADAAVGFLETASKAATAGVTSVDVAGKALTVTLNSYNLAASETTAVSDAMFAAANVGVTTFDELAASFGGVAGIAASSGASYQETLGALAQITTKGISTSDAVTQLKNTFVALSKPNKLVAEALQEQGFASAEAAIKAKGLQHVMETIRQVSTDTGRPLIELVGSVEAVNAILATTGENADASREKMAALASSAGATQAAFDLISETPAQRMAVFQSSVQAAVITLGDAFLPILGALLDALTPLVQGFTAFAQDVLVPLGAAFADLPEPIRLAAAALVTLVGGGAAVVTAVTGATAVMGPLSGALGLGAGSATAATGALGALQAGATSLFATLSAAALPITAVVAVLGTLAFASEAANDALDEQYAKLDKSTAGWGEYAQAAQRAREESGLLASIGFGLNDTLSEMSDELTILGDEISSGLSSAWASISSGASSAMSGLRSALGLAGESVGPLKVSTGAAIDAGEAFLKYGTNIQSSVLESDAFGSAQARLNESLRSGKLDQEQYQKALLATANALSQSQGAGAVLTRQQEQVRTSFSETLTTMAQSSGVLSGAVLASGELATKQGELALAVAQGGTSVADARSQWEAYIAQLAAGDTEMQASIAANDALATGFASLKASLEAGTVSYGEASAQILQLGESAGATQDQIAAMTGQLQGAAISPDLAQFGVSLDLGTLADGDKFQKEMEEIRTTANEAIFGLFSEQLQARHEFQAQEQALIDERPRLIAEAEAKAAEAVAEAQAKGNTDKIAQIQEGLAKEIESINSGNAQKLEALRAGFEEERQARLTALAQAALDQVNSLLQLGQISEQQAKIIFGSLQQAAPDSSLFDPAAAAALDFSATLGQALGGSVEAAVGLGDELLNVDAALNASEAAAQQYEAGAVAAFENARAAVEASAGGAVAAADIETAANQRRIDSALALDGVLSESVGTRQALRDSDMGSATVHADAAVAEDGRVQVSAAETANVLTAEHQRMGDARTTAAGVTRQATDQMVGDTQRLGREAQGTAGIVDQSVGGIGRTYTTSASGVKVGTDAIVTETARANTALSGLGADVPSQLAPAAESIRTVKIEAAGLAEVTSGAAQERADAEKDAGRAATDAADDTVSGFVDVADQSRETVSAVEALAEVLAQLPRRLDIPLQVTGVDKAQAAVATLAKDLAAATGTWTLEIEGRYKGKGPMEPGGSLMLQHDVEDALAAAGPGLNIYGRYDGGGGGAAWQDGALAVTSALGALQAQAAMGILIPADVAMSDAFRRLLYDDDAESRFLQQTLADLARLQVALDEAAAAADRAKAALPQAIQGIAAAIDNFFTADPDKGGLALLVKQFQLLAEQVKDPALAQFDEAFFLGAGILDASSFDDFRRQLADLADEPERQEELWKAFIDALSNRWKVYYERESNNLERQKRQIQAQIDAEVARQKAAGVEDPDTAALDAELDAVDQKLRSLKDQNDDINLTLKEQTFSVEAQFDLYGRLADAAKDRAKVEADAARAVEQALKAAQDAVKARQKESEGAEKSAHEEAMDLLDRELKLRDRAHKAAMKRLDERRKATEADIAAQIAAEEEAHKRRLAAITAEVDAADAVNDAEEARLKRAKLLVETVEAGNALTTEQADFLRSLGIDPDRIAATNAALGATKTQIDDVAKSVDLLKGLLDKLPEEPGRVRIRGSELVTEAGKRVGEGRTFISEEERAALQKGLDSGEITDPRDRRIAEIALAGGLVQAKRLREVLAPLISDRETELENLQKQVETAEKQVDLAGELLARREAALKVAQDEAAVARAALEGQIAAEEKRFEEFKTRQEARLDAIDAEKAALKDRYDTERQAIADAKDAEAERHKARMEQIQREYALELLRLGNTEDEVQRILAEQAKRAAEIAAEARRRFEELLRQAGVSATSPEPGVGAVTPLPVVPGLGPGATVPGTPGGGLVVPLPPPPPPLPPEPGPGVPPEPPEPPPFPFAAGAEAEAAEVLSTFDDLFGTLAIEGQQAGAILAEGLVDPALREMARLMMQAYELRSVLTDIPALGGRIADAIATAPPGARGGGDYTDNSRHFTVHGDVYIRPDDPAGDALLDSLGPRP